MLKFSARALEIPDLLVIAPRKYYDLRGYFMETFSVAAYKALGINCTFVQDNQSMSTKAGTLRGLHFQVPPEPQAKLVRALRGAIFDVAVDIRKGSPSYGQWCGTTLTAESGEQLFIPRGFAHAFVALASDTEIAYKVDGYHSQACDSGLIWNDPDIGIIWPFDAGDIALSEKDAQLPRLRDFNSPFVI